jgi:hypothetical protein
MYVAGAAYYSLSDYIRYPVRFGLLLEWERSAFTVFRLSSMQWFRSLGTITYCVRLVFVLFSPLSESSILSL